MSNNGMSVQQRPATETPENVVERRSDLSDFCRSMETSYRRLIDNELGVRLTACATNSQCQVGDVLHQIAAELTKLPRQAVLANIVIKASSPAKSNDLAKAKYQKVEKLLPKYDPPQLAHDLQVPVTISMQQLREQPRYIKIRNSVVESLVADATEFVECGLLGRRIYDHAAPASHGAYSFILRRVTASEESTSTLVKKFNPDAPFGSRNIRKQTNRTKHKERHVTEERVHYLENLSLLPFETYTKELPPWAKPLREAIPSWVLPEVQVVEGKIVKEEVSVLDDYSRIWETETKLVQKFSPAILLGDLALAGWSDADLQGGISPWIVLGGIGLLGLLGASLFLVPGAAAVATRVGLGALMVAGRAAKFG